MLTSRLKNAPISKAEIGTDIKNINEHVHVDEKQITALTTSKLQKLATTTPTTPSVLLADNSQYSRDPYTSTSTSASASDYSQLSSLQQVESLPTVPADVQCYCNLMNLDSSNMSYTRKTETVSSNTYPVLRRVFGNFPSFNMDVVTVSDINAPGSLGNGHFHEETNSIILGDSSPLYVKINEVLHIFLAKYYPNFDKNNAMEFFSGMGDIPLLRNFTIPNKGYTFRQVNEFLSDGISGVADPEFGRRRLYEMFLPLKGETEEARQVRVASYYENFPFYSFSFAIHEKLAMKHGDSLTATQLANKLEEISVKLRDRYNRLFR